MQLPRVLFIQGAGEGTHDHWDRFLVDDLTLNLGADYQVHFPRLPQEDAPSPALWGRSIRRELARLGDNGVAIGHSVGGTILMATLAEGPPRRLRTIVLIAAPFVGAGGWPGEGLDFSGGLGSSLHPDVSVHLVHGLDDQTVPSSHAQLYAQAIPQACVHRLPGRDHQFGDDLSEVAAVIAADQRGPASL